MSRADDIKKGKEANPKKSLTEELDERVELTTPDFQDLPVCPKMRCNSFCPFPETGILPCAKHGTMLVPYSEAPLLKHIYRWLELKIFKIKYATGKKRV